MTERTFCGFSLAGPLASWGDVTVGDMRTSWPAPSASALMGLIGAALGIARADAAGQASLLTLRFAVRLDAPGVPLRDYHTVQSGKKTKHGYQTRHDELRAETNTKVTERQYYTDQHVTALCWLADDSTLSLSAIAAAFQRPRYPLALGRKACPLSRSVDAHLVSADTIMAAIQAYDATKRTAKSPEMAALTFDTDGPDLGAEADVQILERYDTPISRSADWSFSIRSFGYVPQMPFEARQ